MQVYTHTHTHTSKKWHIDLWYNESTEMQNITDNKVTCVVF